MSRAVIDRHPKRDEIIDALLAGKSLRQVGQMAGISATAVQHYKNNILMPSLEKAGKLAKIEKITQQAVLEDLNPKRIEELTKAIATVGEHSIWRDRQEKLGTIGLDSLDQARAKALETGDFGQVWQGLNACNRTQEIDGKARRILGDDGGASVKVDQMFLILPRIELAEPEAPAAEQPAIDTTLAK